MTYLVLKNFDSLQEEFRKDHNGRTPSAIGHLFGIASYSPFYWQCEFWCSFIDSLVPDWFPMNVVQDFLIAIVRGIHDYAAKQHYGWGVEEGDKVTGEVTRLTEWATSQINNSIATARTKIENEVINPLKAQANTLTTQINTAKGQLTELDRLIKQAQSVISQHEGRIKQLEQQLGEKAQGFKFPNFL